MRKLVVITFLTLDGVMQAPGGKDEDTEGGFKYGGWEMAFPGGASMSDFLVKAGALLIGRKTYDIFAAYWPTLGKDIEWYGPFMNNTPKYVASKTLQKTQWQNSNLLKGDAAEAVSKLKKEAGDTIFVIGSGDLCQTLMRHNLIDEYIMMVYPIVLGSGKRLFRPDGPKQDLELVKSIASNDVLLLTYQVK